jgi:transcriptional regulator with GAF, ATPase, and Fis domain
MVDNVRLLEVLVGFAQTLVRDYDLDDVLASLSSEVADLVEVDGAGVMLQDNTGTLRFVAASDEHIGQVEQVQTETGEGPCVQAHLTGQQVIIDDLTVDQAFPRFTPKALAAGIRAVYSVPLQVADVRLGAFNLYRSRAGRLEADAIRVVQLVGDLATSYVLSVDAAGRATRLADQLQHALESRVVIEQAKGRLSLVWDTDVTAAFERLRQHARRSNRRLKDVATDVLHGRLDPGDIA